MYATSSGVRGKASAIAVETRMSVVACAACAAARNGLPFVSVTPAPANPSDSTRAAASPTAVTAAPRMTRSQCTRGTCQESTGAVGPVAAPVASRTR